MEEPKGCNTCRYYRDSVCGSRHATVVPVSCWARYEVKFDTNKSLEGISGFMSEKAFRKGKRFKRCPFNHHKVVEWEKTEKRRKTKYDYAIEKMLYKYKYKK